MKSRLDIGLKDGLLLKTAFHAMCCDLFYYVIGQASVMQHSLTEEHMKIDVIATVFKYSNFLFTNWNMMFQTVFLTMSLVYDVLEWIDKHETNIGQKLKYYRDILFKGAVVPVTMFVSTMFWTLYWIDRELVFPKVYDQIVPWWFNHCVHTNIAIVVLVETVLQERRHPTNKKIELFLDGFIGVFYAIVYYSIYFFANRWLYGVFGIMNWWQICIYQLMIWGSMLLFYFLQFPVNRIFHREPVMEEKNGTAEVKNGIEENGIPEDKNPDLKFRTQVENSSL